MQYTNQNSSIINDYLQNERLRDFGELNDVKSLSERENRLLNLLMSSCDHGNIFLLEGKLFSKIITEAMANYDSTLFESYLFQQDFLEIFKTIYKNASTEEIDEHQTEIKTAKILWNLIQENQIDSLFWGLSEQRSYLSSEKIKEFISRFNVTDNLINIVQGTLFKSSTPSSIYQETANLIDKALTLYKEKKYKEMIIYFELTLKKIRELEGIEGGAIFATNVGSLLIQKSTNIPKGLYFLKRAEDLYEKLGDNTRYTETLSEMAYAYWALGMYKKALDKLSTEIYLQTLSGNDLAVMNSQERLCQFFRNLSRFIESQEWALNHLNSAIQTSEEQLRNTIFLISNLNYAKTLIGLNSWPKVEAHLSYAERALKQLEIQNEYSQKVSFEIACMRGYMSVIRGHFDKAETYFKARKAVQLFLKPDSPIYRRFLRAEAMLLRSQRKFPEAIKIIQPLFQDKNSVNPLNVTLLAELLALHAHEKEALKLLKHAINVLAEWNSFHGISRIYLSKGYIHLLLGNFKESKKWYQHSLEIIGSDITDLKVIFDANMNLGYLTLEENEIKTAKRHAHTAEECASMSGSLAFLLDCQLLKSSIKQKEGKENVARNILQRVSSEAKNLEINYVYQKSIYRLNNL